MTSLVKSFKKRKEGFMNQTTNSSAKSAVKALAIITAFVVLQGCGVTRMSFLNQDAAVNGTGTPTGNPGGDKLTCIKEHYYQPTTALTKKLDILFVTDTSGSLNAERGAIATAIGNFISQLASNADYQIGVTLSHGPKSSRFGQLYKAGTEPTVLRSSELSLTDIRTHLVKKLTTVVEDSDTDGGEASLLSLNKALDSTRLAEIRMNNNFFRTDAALAIVFVSDENDICAVYPSGVTRVIDPDGKELPAFDSYCKNKVTVKSVYDRLLAVQGLNPLLVSAIVYANKATVPSGGENEFGYGYSEIVSLASGTMVDIAANNIPAGLADIGKAAVAKMSLRTDYTLSYLNVDKSTITAEVDAVQVTHSFDEASNLLRLLTTAGKADSKVVLSYCLVPNSPVKHIKPDAGLSKIAIDNPSTFIPKIEVVNQ